MHFLTEVSKRVCNATNLYFLCQPPYMFVRGQGVHNGQDTKVSNEIRELKYSDEISEIQKILERFQRFQRK